MILVYNGAIVKRDGSTKKVDVFQPMMDKLLVV